MALSCPPRENLQRLLDGLLEDAEEQRLDAHVRACPDCRKLLEELTSTTPESLRDSGLCPLPPLEVAEQDAPRTEVIDRLKQAVRTEGRQAGPSRGLADEGLPCIEGYQLLGVLGQGGMGTVYKAEQLGLQRTVALKMIRAGSHAEAESRARFRTEVRAVGRLQHPNIVQIFDVGEAAGLPYYSLEFVEGGSLADRLSGLPQAPRRAAELVELVARAVHRAHEAGIVHRDLKPANILLTADGAPKIADFGLAKLVGDTAGPTVLSSAGNLIQGTPCYMAPEQAVPSSDGRSIGPATDIYALGTILYEMLTGQPPFEADSPLETALQVVHAEPTPPRRFRPELPRDLETICLKCLEKDPGRRFHTALELAEDLHRFRAGEPIRARPCGRLERSWRWSRRNPAVAMLLVTLAVVLLTGLSLVTWLWRGEAAAALAARAEKEHADQARHDAERGAARSFADLAITQGDHGNVDRALHLLAQALDLAMRGGDANLERGIRLNLTAWRGELVRKRAQLPHGNWVWAAAFSPDGQLCATASRDTTARLWDTATGAPVSEPLPHDHPVWAIAFHPNGNELWTGSGDPVTGAGALRRWEISSGKELAMPFPADNPDGPGKRFVTRLAFSRDGRLLLVVSGGQAHVWMDGQLRAYPHPPAVVNAALSADGRTVATGGVDGRARLWDAASAMPIGVPLDHTPPGGLPAGQDCRVDALAFSGDGELLLTGTSVRDPGKKRLVGGEARLWRARTGEPVGGTWAQPGPVKSVVFSADGRRALTGAVVVDDAARTEPDYKGVARLWDVPTGRPLGPDMQQDRPIWAAAFSPDGRTLLTGSEGGEVQFWRAATCLPLGPAHVKIGNVNSVCFSPDGRSALTTRTYEHAEATLWEVPHSTGDVTSAVSAPGAHLLSFAPDSTRLFTASGDDAGQLWNLTDVEQKPLLLRHQGIASAAFRADSRMLATGGADELVRLWDPASGASLGPPLQPPPGQLIRALAFSRDGTRLVVGGHRGMSSLWDLERGQPLGQPLVHIGWIVAAAFHPDGKSFVVGCDETTTAPHTDTGQPLPVRFRHERGISALAYSPDGTTLATGSPDRTALLWDAATGQPRCSPLQHQGELRTIAFSADGKVLLTASRDRSVRLWDAATGLRIGPLLTHPGAPLAAFRPVPQSVTTIAPDGLVRFWDLPAPARGEVAEIRRWVEALTGKELADKGVLRELDGPALQRLRQQMHHANAPVARTGVP